MNYREMKHTKERVSALGFGCMRFPVIGGNAGQIEPVAATQMLRYAIDNGVNYLDTAYPYHESTSEEFVGRALSDGYRKRVLLATKSPLWHIESAGDFDRLLEEQLKKLNTDYIDFYLLHAVDRAKWEEKVLRLGLLQRLLAAKKAGKVRHIGFSFHDSFEAFCQIVDQFEDCEFCQLQYNYVDTDRQAGTKGLEYAAQKGLDVIIMEPLRGGKLASPPKQVARRLSCERPAVEWALDFLWNRPEVGTVLSGMSDLEQVKQNLDYASRAEVGMLTQEQLAMLEEAKRVFDTAAIVPCTQCGYCMPCPFGVDIPAVYAAYNQTACEAMPKALAAYQAVPKRADACRGCKKCEAVCPQAILSSQIMPQVAELFAKEAAKAKS